MTLSHKKYILLGAACCLLLPLLGCRARAPLPPHPYLGPGEPPYGRPHYRSGYRYRYYPGTQVYYDTSRNLYFYSSGGVWLSAPVLPGSIRIVPDHFVTIELDSPKPYEHHRKVLNRHPPGPNRQKNSKAIEKRRPRAEPYENPREERSRPQVKRDGKREESRASGKDDRKGREEESRKEKDSRGKRALAPEGGKSQKEKKEEVEEEEQSQNKKRPKAFWR